MNIIFTIVKKELTELFRERKTIINSFLLPTLIAPILIIVMIKVGQFMEQKQQEQQISIGLVNAPKDFISITEKGTNTFIPLKEPQDFSILIEEGTIQAAVVFPKQWNEHLANLKINEISIHRNSANYLVNNRLEELIQKYEQKLSNERLKQLGISLEKITPFTTHYIETGEQREIFGKQFGGFIPYIFILSMWGGCLLAAVDLVTGEKERKTIETTLLLPISKFKILMGKTIVAALLGFFPAVLSLLGLLLSIQFIPDIPIFLKDAIGSILNFKSISLTFLLLIPFSIFLAGSIISLITSATSFKEAQSKAAPIIMLIIIPLALAMTPDFILTWSTALIPILNIGLSIKEIMAGTIHMGMYSVILISLISLAAAAIYLSHKKFSDEKAILM